MAGPRRRFCCAGGVSSRRRGTSRSSGEGGFDGEDGGNGKEEEMGVVDIQVAGWAIRWRRRGRCVLAQWGRW